MKKLTILLLLCLFSTITLATETRIRGLGHIGNYVDDDLNIANFPGTLSSYRNMAVYEGGDTSDVGSATLTYYNKKLNLDFGLLLEKPLYNNYLPLLSSSFYRPSTITTLLLGKNNTVFYVGVAGGSSGIEHNYGTGSNSEGQTSLYLNTGVGHSTKGKSPLDLAFHFTLVNEESNDIEADDSKDKADNTGIVGRLVCRKRRALQSGYLRYYMSVGIQYSEIKENEVSANWRRYNRFNRAYEAELGFSYEKPLFKSATLWAGIIPFRYSYQQNETNYSESSGNYSNDMLMRSNRPYIFVSFESKIKTWLTGRIAMKSNYPFYIYTYSSSSGSSTSSSQDHFYSTYNVYYGLSASYKKFKMDVTVNPDMVYNGPNILTGSETESFIGYFSLSYQW